MKVIIREIPEKQQIHSEQAIQHLHHLCENFRMKYGDANVVYLEMAIDVLQKKEIFDSLDSGYYYIKEGKIHPTSYTCDSDYEESIDLLSQEDKDGFI